MAEQQPIDFEKNLIRALGLDGISHEQKIALLDKAANIVQKRLMLRLMDALSPADTKEAQALVGEPEKLIAFMASKVDGVDTMAREEIDRVREEMQEAIEAGVAAA